MNKGVQASIRLALLALLLTGSVCICAQNSEALSRLEFHSSNSELAKSFAWAKRQALDYVYSGTGSIGPWYEAALPGRNAFCMRDVSHQTEGAAALGLFAENHNMLRRFAESVVASRNWAAYWEIDGNGRPSPADYVSDDDFWFNLPANFDVLDATVRMWRWTADNSYRDDPKFQIFFRETLTDYLRDWELQPKSILSRPRIVNRRSQSGRFVNSRGIPSYIEGTTDFNLGADLVASEYRAVRSYVEIARSPEDKALSLQLQNHAEELQHMLESSMWSPDGTHFYGNLRNDGNGSGSGDTLVLYFGATDDPSKIRGALDYVSDPKYWQTINIEEESYVPITLFRYGRTADAYRVLFDLTRLDKPRREYPEVSYAVISAIVSGSMGIEPSNSGDPFDIRTFGQPNQEADWLEVDSLLIRNNTVDIKQDGRAGTTLVNKKGPAIRWDAKFLGRCGTLLANGRTVLGLSSTLPDGTPICSVIVRVPPGSSSTVIAKY